MDAKAPGEAQALLKALKGLGLPQELLQQVHKSLVPAQKPVTSRLRQLAHVDEQLKALRNRMRRQAENISRHKEQLEKMQEKLLNMEVEEDKLKEEFKILNNATPSQCSSRPGSIAGTTPRVSECGDEIMEDLFGPLPSDDEAVGASVNFQENEDASKRARVDDPSSPPVAFSCGTAGVPPPAPPPVVPAGPSVATFSKAIGDGRFSKQEAEKLKRRLEVFLSDEDDREATSRLFAEYDQEMSLL